MSEITLSTINSVSAGANDWLVVSCPNKLSPAGADVLKRRFAEIIPVFAGRILVLEDGVTLSVLSLADWHTDIIRRVHGSDAGAATDAD